ncbi:MAG: hypothetical protein Q7R45_07190 [Sulfuricaulis sp.]|nr:hypothetical protein [Sulfuricaulis sp.]
MTARTDTLAAVGPDWRTARQIHSRVGCWGFTTIRQNLLWLTIGGKIERQKIPYGHVMRHEFRLKQIITMEVTDGTHAKAE